MTAGSLRLEGGEPEKALASWEQAADSYERAGDRLGQNRARINQAQALRELGFYGRSLHQLQQVAIDIAEEPSSRLKSVALRRLGEALRLSGQFSQSENALLESLSTAQQMDDLAEASASLLSLGHTALAQKNIELAQQYYRQALERIESRRPEKSLIVAIQLAQLSLLIDHDNWQAASALWPTIQSQFLDISPSHTNIYHQINWAENLLKAFRKTTFPDRQPRAQYPNLEDIARQLQQAIAQAQQIEDKRAEAYGLGLLGQAYERAHQWAEAEKLTQRAIELSVRSADSLYRWQWQLGKLLSDPNNPNHSASKAIESYDHAIKTLTEIRGDLAAADAQFSFEEKVEPVYREMVSLLLRADENAEIYPQHIKHAQSVIESLRVAELDNYLRESCADVRAIDAMQPGENEAIVYTIILGDRLSILLNLPDHPPQHFSVSISESEINRIVQRLRQTLVTRSRRDYFAAAKETYDFLIAPIRDALESNGIQTIVFVPDGSLQTVPLAALYDGDRFLVESYRIGLTPSLKLISPKQWAKEDVAPNKRTLIGGLTESREGFSALPYVEKEVRSITNLVNSSVLLNQDFTKAKLTKRLKDRTYPIVHIATHGQLGSTPDETFIVTWDGRINVREVNQMLQANLGGRDGIELLILSACETAISDPKAGLGLAGVAIKAGASSTLGSLWAIDDEATAHFVEAFYRQLLQPNTTRSEALRQAQLSLIQDPQYQHPIYWAAYILLGSWL